ncbi:MAG: glycosyltransferase [Chloroflexota bacterium]
MITGKTYQFLAMAKPTVVGELTNINEVFQHKENCLLVPQGNAEALANAIYWAYENRDKLPLIAMSGRQLYQTTFSTEQIGQRLRDILFKIDGIFLR